MGEGSPYKLDTSMSANQINTDVYTEHETCDDALDQNCTDELESAQSFEEKLELLEMAVTRHPLHRELLYRTLVCAQTEQELSVLEQTIQSFPEFELATQNPYRLITFLERSWGLARIERDEAGNRLFEEDMAELSEEDREDLICTTSFITTTVGLEFVERHAPRARILELFDAKPERAGAFQKILASLDECPQSYSAVCELLDGNEALRVTRGSETYLMQPSVFLDQLERAGAIRWEGGWMLTVEGREYLGELSING